MGARRSKSVCVAEVGGAWGIRLAWVRLCHEGICDLKKGVCGTEGVYGVGASVLRRNL